MMNIENSHAPAPERALAEHSALSETSRVAILEELRSAGAPLDAVELARRVSLHHNTVRWHLEILLNAGLIESEPERREGRGRRRILYRAVAQPSSHEDAGGSRLLAYILASYVAGASPDPEAAAVEAGHERGRYLVQRPAPFAKVSEGEAMERLTGLFHELGFEPEVAGDGAQPCMHLHRCPFRDLASTHPEIACSVHLGLTRGALAEMRAPLEGTNIDRFVGPSRCVAHFRSRDRSRQSGEPSTASFESREAVSPMR